VHVETSFGWPRYTYSHLGDEPIHELLLFVPYSPTLPHRGVMADDGDDLFPIAVLIDELKTDDTQV